MAWPATNTIAPVITITPSVLNDLRIMSLTSFRRCSASGSKCNGVGSVVNRISRALHRNPAFGVRCSYACATPRASRTADALASAKSGWALLHEGADPLAHVVAVRDQRLREGLLDEQGVDVRLEGAIEKALREPDGERRTVRQTPGPLARGRFQLGRGHDLVDEAEPLGVRGGEVVAEEHELLRLVQADVARKQEPATGIERNAAPHEHLDEPRRVGGEDEVAGVGEVRAETGRRAVDGRDDRLLEIPERANHTLARSHRVAGRARVWLRLLGGDGARAGEIGARAEAVAGGGEDDGAEVGCRSATLERVEVGGPHLGVERVLALGAVEHDPAHPVVDRERQRLRLGHGM